jgi:DUF4097 and DUF4098 domain-containing protein YvlB
MTRNTGLLASLPLVFLTVGCYDQTAVLERRLERTFHVAPGSTVRVELAGGSVTAETGPPGQVHVSIRQAVHTDEGESAANRILADYRVDATQEGPEILVVGRRQNLLSWTRWRNRVDLSATVTAPPDVVLDLGTSGGRISVRGDRTAQVNADTSGGSVSADGGSGDLRLNTSGGSIRVGRVLGRLNADTSGGGINVAYVGPTARDVVLTTSGGSIRVGVDPKASLAVDAGTSGGSVRVEDLPFDVLSHGRSHANGTINGGSNRLRASTSGGGISIRGVEN